MDLITLKTKTKETKGQFVGFVRRHWKGISLVAIGTTFIYYALSRDGTEVESLGEGIIASIPDPDLSLFKASENALSGSTRPYRWDEYSHPVREHPRHYSNGSEGIVRGYTKITGGREIADDLGSGTYIS